MGWWSKNTGNEQGGKEPPRSHTPGRQPFWGTKFRTRTFFDPQNPDLGHFYLRAVKRANGSWDVLRVTGKGIVNEALASSAADPVESFKPEKTGLEFFEALNYCAVFETAQPLEGINRACAEADEIKKLGFVHYKAFGEREGYKFDGNGRPHETEGGEIVTEGDFRQSDQQSFDKNFTPAQEKLRSAFNAASNEELSCLMGQGVDYGTLEKTLQILAQRGAFKALKDTVGEMYKDWQSALRWGFENSVNYTALHISQTASGGGGTLQVAVEKNMDKIAKALRKIDVENSGDDLFRGFEICYFSFYVQRAQSALYYKVSGNREGSDKEILEYKRLAMESARRLGMSAAQMTAVEAAILKGMTERPTRMLPEVEKFVNFIRQMDQNIVQEAQRQIAASSRIRGLLPHPA